MSILALTLVLALQAAPSGAAAEAEIDAVLDRLNVASTAADAEAYFALFTPNARFIGTDATEHWTLEEFRSYASPHFARGNGWSYPATDRTITIAPIDCRCVAWFEEKLASERLGDTRGSGVLRLTDDGWKIEQYVLSFAIPNNQAEAVVQMIRTAGADSVATDADVGKTPQND